MLPRGIYKNTTLGCTYNVVGISRSTEDAELVLVFQELSQSARCHLKYVRVGKPSEAWIRTLSPIKEFKVAQIYGIPPSLPHWPVAGTYRHFKGGTYNCIGVAVEMIPPECEASHRSKNPDANLMMVYQSLYGDRIYQLAHRPLAMFIEHVEKPEHKYSGPRFLLIEAKNPTIARPAQQKLI